MAYLTVNALLISLMLLSPSCSQKGPKITSWSIQLSTSGGFVGIGKGNLKADSEGRLVYEKPVRRNAQPSSCEGKLGKDELDSLSAAIAQLKPDGWHRAELDRTAPDAYHYALSLKRGKDEYKVSWADNTVADLPTDLRDLNARLSALMRKQSQNCKDR